MRWAFLPAVSAFALAAAAVANAAEPAQPAATAAAGSNLQSPEQVSTRYSAYTLPARQWSMATGALGVGDGDVYAVLAITYGLGAGLQLNMNLAHASVGLLNAGASWHFIDTRYFDLKAALGVWYGHGDWFWIAEPLAKKILSKIDVVKVPLELTASSTPNRWLQFDLGLQYDYARIFGASSQADSLFTDNQLGLTQVFVRPGARLFIADNTAFELFARLPFYSAVVGEGSPRTVPFKHTWAVEAGLRSRFTRGVFGNIRLNYAPVSDLLYGARFYPAFEVEFRP